MGPREESAERPFYVDSVSGFFGWLQGATPTLDPRTHGTPDPQKPVSMQNGPWRIYTTRKLSSSTSSSSSPWKTEKTEKTSKVHPCTRPSVQLCSREWSGPGSGLGPTWLGTGGPLGPTPRENCPCPLTPPPPPPAPGGSTPRENSPPPPHPDPAPGK